MAVAIRWGGTGKSSGVAFEEAESWLFTLRGGKVVGVEEFPTPEQALAAAAMQE